MRARLLKVAASIAVLALLANGSRAQVANDTCATAMPIGEGLVSGDTTLAQSEITGLGCSLEWFVKDVWYRFDAVEKGQLKATFGCDGSNFDPGLVVRKGECGAFVYSDCNDDYCQFQSQIQAMVLPSQPLYVEVAGVQGTIPFGQFTLKVTVDPVSQFVIAAYYVAQGVGGFTGPLKSGDAFGEVAALGDYDGDGVVDVAVGAPGDDDEGSNAGAVWVLRQSVDGTVLAQHKLAGLGGSLAAGDAFGTSIAGLGDLDGDGDLDLAVAAPLDDDGATSTGSVWIVFLTPGATLSSLAKISPLSGGFGGALDSGDGFGSGLAALGDVDGDGVGDLAVGASGDDDGGADAGAVWILFLHADGSVKAWQKLSATSGGFPGPLEAGDNFGAGVCAAGDIDGDGVPDLAVGAPFGGPGGEGAVWTVLLHADGTIKAAQQIGASLGGFDAPLFPGDQLGASLCSTGDVSGDGVPDLAIGAPGVHYPGGSTVVGSVFRVLLKADGTVQQQKLLTEHTTESFFPAFAVAGSLAFPGDIDGDGNADLLVGEAGTTFDINWYMTVFLSPDNPWATLTVGALAGASTFAPELRGKGPLQPGTPWQLELAIAARNSPAAFVAGTSTADLPFKGGILVPAPAVVISGLLTDVHGRLVLQGIWPAGVPAGSLLWIQGFVVDAGAPAGLSASNAVRARTP
jgi:hypothetical protein